MTGFAYPSEKFSTARRFLMLPHPNGEASSITHAFHECSLGLAGIDKTSLDDDALGWIRQLEELMNTDGLEDPDGKAGLRMVKAESLTINQKSNLSSVVDTLAYWFKEQLRR
jgi:hypothetical protein